MICACEAQAEGRRLYNSKSPFTYEKSLNYQSDNRRHVVDCVQQVFQQSFYHVDHLETLEI